MNSTINPLPLPRRTFNYRRFAAAVLLVAGFMALAAHGTDLTAVEGVAVYRDGSGGISFYTMWNFSRTSSQALLKDSAAAVIGHDNLPSRFLCSDTGTVSNGLPVLLVLRAMPSSISIPAFHDFFPQGPDVAAGEGNTIVGSDVHADPDMDHDGVPTYFESAHGSNPAVADADFDADGDGHSLLQEYWAGTDPQNSQSVLRLKATPTLPSGVTLSWSSIAGKHYEVQSAGSTGGPFAATGEVTATSEFSELPVTGTNAPGFYRLLVQP